MTIYELTGAAAQLYALLENEEIDAQTVADTLEAMGADEKIDGCCKVIKQLEADAANVKAEADRLAKRAASISNNAKYARQRLTDYLQVTGQTSVKTLAFTVSQRTTQAVMIAEGAELPQEYLKITTAPDKTALKTALLAGKKIDGVTLADNASLTIR